MKNGDENPFIPERSSHTVPLYPLDLLPSMNPPRKDSDVLVAMRLKFMVPSVVAPDKDVAISLSVNAEEGKALSDDMSI